MIYNSVIISFVSTLLQKISCFYSNSSIGILLKKFSLFFKTALANSGIWNFIKRRDFFSKVWKFSGIFLLCDWALNVIPRTCNRIYFKFEDIFSQSFCVRFLKMILRRFEVIIAIILTIIVIVPHNYWNNAYNTLLMLAITFLYFLKIVVYKYESFNLKAFDFMLFLFMLSVVLATLISSFPKDSLKFLTFYATCFLLVLVIVSSIKTERSLGLFLEVFLVGITISALYGIYQAKIVGIPVDPSLTDINVSTGAAGRLFSSMGNPNNYAEVLIVTLPFYLSVILNAGGIFKKVAYAVLAVPVVVALGLTQARSSWIALAGAMLVYVFFKNKKLIPLLIILAVAGIPFLPSSIYLRLQTITKFSVDTSAQYRIQILQTVLPMLRDNWVSGVGLGTDAFMKICENYFLFTKKTPPHAHNLFLQIWLEAGFAGVVTFMWFIIRMIKNAILEITSCSNKYINNILLAGISGVMAVLVMGMAEYIWYYPRVMLVFWCVIGIILAGLNIIAGKREGISQCNGIN